VATPDEIEVKDRPVVLREPDHFWLESKNRKQGEDWISTPIMRHTSTPGLLIQANAIGAHAHSRVVILDRQCVRVVAWGYQIHASGMLEVIEKSKEYDLSVELMKAALKKVRATKGTLPESQTTALVKTATEETALALVGTLPPYMKAEVMEARLEVQSHREALCRSKAENMILRVFIAKAGGVLKREPGFGEIKLTLQEAMLKKRLSAEDVKAATDSLYGAPAGPAEVTPQPVAAEEPPEENAHIVGEEEADRGEQDAAAEDAADAPPETGPDPDRPLDEQPPTQPAQPPAAAVPMERYALLDAWSYAFRQVTIQFDLPSPPDLSEEAADNIAASMRVSFAQQSPSRRKALADIAKARCKDLDIPAKWPWPQEPKGGAA
jgi:hypothetical protein